EKAWRLSNLLFKYRSIRRKLGITQPFMDQIGVHGIPPRDLRDRYPRRAGLPADRHLLLIRPEPLLLTRHICTQDVHYQRGTLINTLYDASVKAGRTLTVAFERKMAKTSTWGGMKARQVPAATLRTYMTP
ncbi:hypothetical protein, partial [Pseudorhodobacter aquimaris]|uniref:hypothetical protein n=1 Tax=Pseudorhodobacter aquimaris TaxID=687412 RepID=UPI001E3AC6AC